MEGSETTHIPLYNQVWTINGFDFDGEFFGCETSRLRRGLMALISWSDCAGIEIVEVRTRINVSSTTENAP